MLNKFEAAGQTIINVLEEELSYFEQFVHKNNIRWAREEKNNSILTISQSYVGYLVTPVRKINLEPKYNEIGFEHIFRMYLYVYGYKTSDSSSVLDISDAQNEADVAELFLDNLQKNIQLGIIQSYQISSEKLKFIKGNVHYPTTYKNYLLNKKKYVKTKVSSLSLDNDINKLIATALFKLKNVKKYTSTAAKFLMYFENVPPNVKNGSELLKKINFNSNTSRYRNTLIYASMIIDQLDYEDVGNTIGTESFIINFDRLFEDFVVKILKETPVKREFSTWDTPKKYADIIKSDNLYESREYQPDIVYRYLVEDENYDYLPSAYGVLDVKNKAYSIFNNNDIYQIVTYASLLHSKKVVLLYPSFLNKRPETLILNSDIFNPYVITACFINIADKSGKDFLKSIKLFVDTVEKVLLDIKID